MLGNKNGSKVFRIPVEWVVSENLEIVADSIEEAIKFVKENNDLIPINETGEA